MTAADTAHRRSLRESWIILAAFAAVTVWVLAVCGVWGYREDRAIRVKDAARAIFVERSGSTNKRWMRLGEVFDHPVRLGIFVRAVDCEWSKPDLECYEVPAGYQAFSDGRRSPDTALKRGDVLAAPIEDGPTHLATVMGIPAWAFWGIMMPWVASTVFTVWFAMRGMADEAMGDDAPDANLADRTAPFPVKPSEAPNAP